MANIKMKMGKPTKNEMYKGNISISSKDIPEIKDWNIGDKVSVMVDIEVSELRKCDKYEVEEYGMKPDSIKAYGDIKTIKLK